MRKSLLLMICCTLLITLLSIPPVNAQLPAQTTTVFLIVMENHNWSQIKGSKSAPYLNSLLAQGAHAEAYFNPPGLHPSLPNYIWLEAGTNFGITNDLTPSVNHQASTAHLTTLLDNIGISWKAYQEGIVGNVCPLVNQGLYAVRHNSMVYFDDVTGVNNPQSAYCIAHERPYTELAADLTSGNVAQYNYITPNLCNDMHNSSGCATRDQIKNGDNWLKQAIPPILASNAYQNGGIIFITWDEGASGDGPIGMIVLSPYAKTGFSNTIHYTHSSTLRTLQELFGVEPLLGNAGIATNLIDLFATYPSKLPVPPANDNFANSLTISSLPYSNTQTDTEASLENVEQKASCEGLANIQKTVWYKYKATVNQQVTFSVTGSNVVKGISVWTGTVLGGLTQVGCGIPSANTTAKVDTTNGAVYYIRVGSSNGVDSNLIVQAGLPPANDDLANAIVINTGFAPFSDTHDIIGASLEPDDPVATCGGPAFRTVWYKYSSLDQYVLSLDTAGSGYDTVLSVWTGSDPGALVQVGCNDNNGALLTSALNVNTTPGITYYIRVGGKTDGMTNLNFNMLTTSVAGGSPLQNYFSIATPNLTWNRVTGATQYMVQVSKSSLFTNLAYTAIVSADQLSVTTNPLDEGYYYWRVSADQGVTWSESQNFVVDLP